MIQSDTLGTISHAYFLILLHIISAASSLPLKAHLSFSSFDPYTSQGQHRVCLSFSQSTHLYCQPGGQQLIIRKMLSCSGKRSDVAAAGIYCYHESLQN